MSSFLTTPGHPRTSATRAWLFGQLAQASSAGLDPDRTLGILLGSAPAALQSPLTHCRTGVQQGHSLADSGLDSHLLLPWEARVLAVAGEAGRLEQTLGDLAHHYRQRADRLRRLRSKLLLPLFVVGLGILLAPLPGLIQGNFGPVGYLFRIIIPGIIGVGLLRALLAAFQRMEQGVEDHWLAEIMLRIPLLRRRRERNLLADLYSLLRAGVAILDALALLRDSAPPQLRRELQRVLAATARGDSAVTALASAGLIQDVAGIQVLQTGDYAGRLEESLERYLHQLDDEIQTQLEFIADWLPRLLYFGAVALVLL